MIESWDRFPNFSRDEFKCSHTGECDMREELVIILQQIRDYICKPIFISSGYRSPEHPLEAQKDKPGEHTEGMAVDIICYGQRALQLIDLVRWHGIERIGLHQKGRVSGRYMHLGIGDHFTKRYPPAIWTY